jgi:hypothetical protein
MDYLQRIKQLPLPTAQQIADFAEHVSEAHSWYKHLPLTRAKPFYFYLDPNAGRGTVYSATGEPAFIDIVDEKDCFHYSTLLTSTYRQQFGFWSYQANYGTRFYSQGSQGWMTTEKTSTNTLNDLTDADRLAIFVPEDGWLALPEWLMAMGRVPVTALLSPRRNLLLSWVDSDQFWRLEYPHYLNHELVEGPRVVLDAMRDHYNFGQSSAYQAERQAHNENSQTLDSFASYQKWKETASSQYEDVLYAQVEAAMDQEHQRQLGAIRDAMTQVVEAIYGGSPSFSS